VNRELPSVIAAQGFAGDGNATGGQVTVKAPRS
jgi:hypothetical protein